MKFITTVIDEVHIDAFTFGYLGEGPETVWVLALLLQLLDEDVINSGHVREGGHDGVLEPALLDLIVDLPLALQGVAPELAHGALADGVV